MGGFSDLLSLFISWHGGSASEAVQESVPLCSEPSALPSVTLNGVEFYIRADSYNPDLTTVAFKDTMSLTGKIRRLTGTKGRGWEFVVALRSWEDRLQLESMLSEVAGETIDFTISDEEYEVTIDSMGTMTTVGDNVDFWDVKLTLAEWLE